MAGDELTGVELGTIELEMTKLGTIELDGTELETAKLETIEPDTIELEGISLLATGVLTAELLTTELLAGISLPGIDDELAATELTAEVIGGLPHLAEATAARTAQVPSSENFMLGRPGGGWVQNEWLVSEETGVMSDDKDRQENPKE